MHFEGYDTFHQPISDIETCNFKPARIFDIGSNYCGFLPDIEPLRRLNEAYYSPWEHLIDNFHDLVLTRRLREAVLKVLP